jgi:pyruvate ferredoxin oxidoreductase delta subunit
MIGMDLDHCKGCGICAQECPQKAIKMMEETKLREAVK